MENKLKIAIIYILNNSKPYAMNKDLNGGFGTADDYGDSWTSRIVKKLKKKQIRLPIVGIAFLQALLKQQGHEVQYFEGHLPETPFDLILLYGSIVDYHNENKVCEALKEKFPNTRVGFFGPFPSRNPGLFKSGGFVLLGEAEAFFMNDFNSLDQMQGNIPVTSLTDMDALPNPDFTGFPIKEYSYSPAISQKPFVTLAASRGCPYSCSFYCTYGEYQGPKIRLRSPKKVVDDMIHVKEKYGVKGVQFRDPTFGLHRGFIEEFCDELEKRKVNMVWGMETRLDLLDEEKIKKMFQVGLRNINIGIETIDPEIAKKNKRILIKEDHQQAMIKFCTKLGVKISAFYILAYEGDTEETVKNTIKYAIRLNTPLARFAVSTPYPGTGFYAQLDKEGRLLTKNYEKYTQFNLVYKHPNLTQEKVRSLVEKAIRDYYFRPAFYLMHLKWKIRGF